jgi:hypothetical protein
VHSWIWIIIHSTIIHMKSDLTDIMQTCGVWKSIVSMVPAVHLEQYILNISKQTEIIITIHLQNPNVNTPPFLKLHPWKQRHPDVKEITVALSTICDEIKRLLDCIVRCTLWVNSINNGSVCLQPLLGNGQPHNNGSDQCFLCGLLRGWCNSGSSRVFFVVRS